MKYAAYSDYKASRVEWLDVVPSHWTVKAARFGYSIQLGKMLQPESSSSLDAETPYLKSQHVQWESVRVDDLPLMWASPSELVKYGIQDGDLLVCEGGDVGRAGIVKEMPKGTIIQNALHRVRPRVRHDIRFLMYVLEHAAGQSWFDIICNRSTIAHFTGEKFGALRVPAPPLDEQQTIVHFLDAKTAQIDALLAQKRQLIDKLKEKRQALIARTVTRGLPSEAAKAAGLEPNPEMKDSGVDWLGEIPMHWDIEKFSREVHIAEGQVDPEIEPFASMYLIAPNHIESGTGRLLALETAAEQFAESGKYLCPAEAVIYSKIRPALRKVVIAPEPCLCSADMYPLTCKKKLLNPYLYWLLLSDQFSAWSVLEADRVAMPKINRETLNELRLPVPPQSEQVKIVEYLTGETAKVDHMLTKADAVIISLTEYRQALITSAVTGKIDVRELA